jgi:hypothetical protein
MGLSFKLFLDTTIACISFCASQCFSQAFITTQRIAPIGVINFESNQQVLPPEGFVNGYVRKGGSGNFIFPVGDDDIYGPFSANGDNVSGAYYHSDPAKSNEATSFAGGPFSSLSKDSNISKVSNIEFWDINGVLPTSISLSWSSNSQLASLFEEDDLSLLRIVGWNGSKWVVIPSAFDNHSIFNKNSSLTSGSVTTLNPIQPDAYQVYTLAMVKSGALPVTLASFVVKKEEGSTSLHWVTASEVNNSYFEIQRSLDGKYWYRIGRVERQGDMNDAGTTAILREYEFTDISPAPKENLYRLKMVDMDQSFSYSQVRSVFYDNSAIAVVYPNPVVDRLYFGESTRRNNSQMSIFNSRGENMIGFMPIPVDGISLAHFTPGVYMVAIKSLDGKVSNSKVVVGK